MKKITLISSFLITIFILGSIMIDNKTLNNDKLEMIPRSVLFGNPDKSSLSLSADGNNIAFIAPRNNVLNVFVASRDNPQEAKAVTNDQNRGIRSYFWSYTHSVLFYLQDVGGDENWQLHKVNIETLEDVNLSPEPGVRTEIYAVSKKFPSKIIIGNNERNKSYFDLFELDITDNQKKLLFTNDEYQGFTLDDEYNIRFLHKPNSDGGTDIFEYNNGEIKPFFSIPFSDITTTYLAGFDKTGRILYMSDSLSTNTSSLIEWNLDNGEKKQIFHNEKAEIANLMVHPTEKTIQAVSSSYLKEEWTVLDEKIKQHFEYLSNLNQGELNITSRSNDDKFWIAAYLVDDGPVSYYLYDTHEKKAKFLFSNRKKLEEYKLAKMHVMDIKSRDGLNLPSYLTLPRQESQDSNSMIPKKPVPLVLYVHGGPSARDNWGYNTVHQWLADRGYAVLSVNYRGSTGFGKQFFKAGNGEWSAKMHDDLIDAVNWAIKEKIADKNKICIMGGSYGGYATLVGLTFTPDIFACGVDIVGPSNLLTLLNSIPAYWKPAKQFLINITGGDPETEEGKKILASKSPINFVDKISKPLLIGQGANDPRVKQDESDQIVNAMEAKKIPVTYILYPDEGHGFARPENRMSFYAITEGFLAKYLNGKFEKITNDFENSSINIVTGNDFVEGIEKKY